MFVSDEVVTTDDEADADDDMIRTVRPRTAETPLPTRGEYEKIHDPDEPIIMDDATTEEVAQKPLLFYVRTTADANNQLCRITLPKSWAKATVSRLVDMLAKRAAVPHWDCHLVSARGPVGNGLPLSAALVRREIVELARGPPPIAAERARTRRSLWMWGRCVDGTVHTAPCRQMGLHQHEITRLALGDEHVLAATSVGLCLTWGRNDCGQLGTGDERSHALPRVVRALAVTRCVDVSAGARCSGAIDESGELWSFGSNQPSNRPQRFHASWANQHGKTPCGLDTRAIAFGWTHALLLTREEGEVWTCTLRWRVKPTRRRLCMQSSHLKLTTHCACCACAACAARVCACVCVCVFFAGGYNESLQLGWADAPSTPVLRHGFQKPRAPLPGLGRVIAIACGEAHSACLVTGGVAYAWGDNSTGQCGVGTALLAPVAGLGACVATPAALPMPRGETCVRSLQCLGNATLVVTASGRACVLGGGGRVRGPTDDDDTDEEGEEGEDGADADDADDADAVDAVDAAAAAVAAPGAIEGAGDGGARGSDAAGGDGVAGGGGGAAPTLSRGLGRLLGAKMLSEDVEASAGCEDHLLLLRTDGVLVGLGYNRYRQASPDSDALSLAEPTAIRARRFRHERILTLAAGGGCSAIISEARESLAACCVAVLRAKIEEGDAALCAQLLGLASQCETPALAPLLPAAEQCCRRKRAAVKAELRGLDIDEALAALAASHREAAGIDVA